MRRLSTASALVIGLFFAWELGVGLTGTPEYILPAPSAFLRTFWQTLPLQIEHLSITAATTFTGLALALVAGVFLALAVVYVTPLKAVVLPALAAFNGIPKVAIAPLFVIWFGLGDEPKVLLAFLMSLFPVFVNAVSGLGEVEPDVIDLARRAAPSCAFFARSG